MWAVMTHHIYFGTRPLTIHMMYGTNCRDKQYICMGSIHMDQLQQPEALLRPMQGLVYNMTMEMWASRMSWVSQKKISMFVVKMPSTSKIDNLIGWNAGNATHVTLEQKSVLVQRHPHNTHAQHWHQHHSELGSALGNAICISYAA